MMIDGTELRHLGNIPPLTTFFYRQTLLDLGASPDYKDSRGLTPLYHSSMVGGDPYCCELLLHDHAQVGCVDENGWQEIHQVLHSDTHSHSKVKQVCGVCRIQNRHRVSGHAWFFRVFICVLSSA